MMPMEARKAPTQSSHHPRTRPQKSESTAIWLAPPRKMQSKTSLKSIVKSGNSSPVVPVTKARAPIRIDVNSMDFLTRAGRGARRLDQAQATDQSAVNGKSENWRAPVYKLRN